MARGKRKNARKVARKSSPPKPASVPVIASATALPLTDAMDDADDQDCHLNADVYLAERGRLIDIEQEGYNQHDKAILSLTAGALALSIAFLRVISASPPVCAHLLLLSWIFLGIAIIATLTSFVTSQRACRYQLKLLDEEYTTGNVPPQLNRWSDWTLRLNAISYISFVLGAGALVCFTWLNIPGPNVGKLREYPPEQKQLEIQMDSTRLEGDSR